MNVIPVFLREVIIRELRYIVTLLCLKFKKMEEDKVPTAWKDATVSYTVNTSFLMSILIVRMHDRSKMKVQQHSINGKIEP